jgi:hypothetical protein
MQKKINVIQTIESKNEKLVLEAEKSSYDATSLVPTGQMLVDSDSVAFIYKLENDTEFVYLSLPYSVWGELKATMDTERPVSVLVNHTEIRLEGIIEELEYLVSNIEGNANYGEEMVSKVEEIFLA